MIPAPTINAAGRALFGPAWHGPLAAALGINVRTLQRWAGEKSAPSPEAQAGIARDLLRILHDRKLDLARIEMQLSVSAWSAAQSARVAAAGSSAP